jgi:hypothetical protein
LKNSKEQGPHEIMWPLRRIVDLSCPSLPY